MIRIGSKRVGRAIVKDLNVSSIYLGPKLVWGREIELLQMFKASVIADGGIFDEELFTTEFFRVHQTIRNEAIVLIVCGAYKAGIIYGINCITGQAVPFTFGRASVGTYIDKYGKIQTAGTNIPRIDYDPVTLGLRGYLNENGGVNILPRSNRLDLWDRSGDLSVTYNTIDDSWFLRASSNFHNIRMNALVNPNTTYTFSFFAKKTASTLSLKYCVRNVTTSSDIITPTSYENRLTKSDYRRISVTFTTPEVCEVIAVYVARDSGTPLELLVNAAQVEVGGYATSYISTSGSQQTRAADSLRSQTDLFSDAASSVYMEGSKLSSNVQDVFFSRFAAGSYGYIWYNSGSADQIVMWDGTATINETTPNGLKVKLISSVGPGGMKLNVNGGVVRKGSYDGNFGAGIINLAGSNNNPGRIQSHLRAFAILHRQLSDAEHIAITQP